MHRPLVRALIVAVAVVGALTACTGDPAPAASGPIDCDGKVKVVLLSDESATTPTAFDAADAPKIFGIAATPVPSCTYLTGSEQQQDGQTYAITDRTYLYIGISDADAKKLVDALRATTGAAPWVLRFDDSPAPAPSGAPASDLSATAEWDYNLPGGPSDAKGSMGYALSTPVSPGLAIQAGIAGDPNVLRIETELRSPKK